MDLQTYLRAIRKNWWLLLLATVLVTGLEAGRLQRTPKQYASSVTFFVSTPVPRTGNNAGALDADTYAQRRIDSYVVLVKSEILARDIAAAVGAGMRPADVPGKLTAASTLNTVLLKVVATDTSPARSKAVAQAISTEFPKFIAQMESVDSAGAARVKLTVTSGPTLRSTPVAPRRQAGLLVALAVGLALGLAAAVARELLDTTVHTTEQLQSLTGRTVLGAIRFDRAARRDPVVDPARRPSIRAEAYRQLRTNLQFVDATDPAAVILVTSAVAGEGKSTTSVNLAVTFAEADRTVLLIEADLRRPKVAGYLGLEGAIGLTNVLVGQLDLEDVLQPYGDSGLTVMASGTIPPNPSELLGGTAMANLLQRLRQRFDVIILDSPPLLPVTDAAVTSRIADGVVMVVRHGHTSRNQISDALRSLDAVNARVLGLVLTMRPARAEGSVRYDGYGYDLDEHSVTIAAKPVTAEVDDVSSIGAMHGASDPPPVPLPERRRSQRAARAMRTFKSGSRKARRPRGARPSEPVVTGKRLAGDRRR